MKTKASNELLETAIKCKTKHYFQCAGAASRGRPSGNSCIHILWHSQWESQSEYGTLLLYFISKDSSVKSIK